MIVSATNILFYAAIVGLFTEIEALPQTNNNNRNRDLSMCTNGTAVHVILARDVDERLGKADNIIQGMQMQMPGSNWEDVQYIPASNVNAVQNGTRALVKAAGNYARQCKKSKVVLMGTGTGAQVIADAFTGGGSIVNNQATEKTVKFNRRTKKTIKSIILFSDPNRVGGQVYGLGSCQQNATQPRSGKVLINFNKLGNKMQSLCDASDPVCCRGGNDPQARLNYFGPDAADVVIRFVRSKVEN